MARRYTRDNRGRFSSVGATARGGRLRTAAGNKRATQIATTAKRATPSGAIRRTDVVNARVQNGISKNIERRNKAGLNPSTAAKEKQASRIARAERRIAGQGRDTASVNIPMAGARGRALDREISRNVKAQKAADRADSKARNRQFKSDQSRAKALRTAHVGAIAKAKGLSKGQVESALKAQSPSVQIKALKNWVRDNRGTNAKPATAKGRTIGHSEAYARRSEAQLRRGIETGRRAQAYLSSQNAYAAPIGSRLSNAWGKAGRVEWGSRNALNSIANKRLNEARKNRKGGFS